MPKIKILGINKIFKLKSREGTLTEQYLTKFVCVRFWYLFVFRIFEWCVTVVCIFVLHLRNRNV